MSDAIIVKRPVVAGPAQKAPVAAAATALGLAGLGIFFWLSAARAAATDSDTALPSLAAVSTTDSQGAVPPVAAPRQQAAPAPGPFFVPQSGPVALVASPPANRATTSFTPPIGFSQPSATPVDPLRERMRAPALVVDFAQADTQRLPGTATETRSDSGDRSQVYVPLQPAPTTPAQPGNRGSNANNDRILSDTERFASRVGGEEAEVAQARRMTGLDRLVPQGAVLGAVMETALNSDQPGFARAMTQRDMYSFDGSAILIPAGSRLIGQYKSGVAQGASRLFVIWTRLIRPDGVSIELASPATDDLGRGGIGGKVNRHFVQRFGGAILTSVLTGGLGALAASRSGGSTIIVGSAGQASSLAAQATQSNDIPPTITTRQGALIRVFVARDLDFRGVGPAR